jgi:hypothetical protein
MTITHEDLQDFHRFAGEQLTQGVVDSMSELAAAWEARRAYEQSVAALRESHQDAEAGRVTPADEVFAKVRRKLGWTE